MIDANHLAAVATNGASIESASPEAHLLDDSSFADAFAALNGHVPLDWQRALIQQFPPQRATTNRRRWVPHERATSRPGLDMTVAAILARV